MTYDVVVVGAGIAGWTAGLRAAQLGASTLIIDKSPGNLGAGNSLMTSGSFYTAGMVPTTAPETLFRTVMTQGAASAELVRAWAGRCASAVDWLVEAGVDVTADPRNGHPWLEHESRVCLGPVYRQDVGTKILTKLRARFEGAGGTFWPSTKALWLNSQPTGLAGLTVERERVKEEIATRSVILATGGFAANKEMLTRYLGPLAAECKLRGSTNDTGDGLRMALDVGAAAVNLAYFYGHLQSLKCLTDDRFWPYPRVDSLVLDGVLVDRAGRRFVDERRGDVAVSNVLARSHDPRGACLIFDQRAWDAARTDQATTGAQVPGPNPWLQEHEGDLKYANSVEELGHALDINSSELASSISEAALEFQPPLYGLRVVPGITFTMGGIAINGQAQALASEGQPIAGLYAAGDAIGGLMGGYTGGYTGGLSQAVITGLLAGENAVR